MSITPCVLQDQLLLTLARDYAPQALQNITGIVVGDIGMDGPTPLALLIPYE